MNPAQLAERQQRTRANVTVVARHLQENARAAAAALYGLTGEAIANVDYVHEDIAKVARAANDLSVQASLLAESMADPF